MLHDQTQDIAMQLLVNQTRRAALAGPALAAAHRRLGAALAPFVAARLTLREVPLDHVAGRSVGVELAPDDEPIIVVLMRAGLFVAEGLWEVLGSGALVPWAGDPDELANVPVEGRPLVVVDAVINSGRSIDSALEALLPRRPSSTSVVALVANNEGLNTAVDRWSQVDFVVARVSQRSYVGRGGTDTGARLFGTTTWVGE